jgi:hypothetical protein
MRLRVSFESLVSFLFVVIHLFFSIGRGIGLHLARGVQQHHPVPSLRGSMQNCQSTQRGNSEPVVFARSASASYRRQNVRVSQSTERKCAVTQLVRMFECGRQQRGETKNQVGTSSVEKDLFTITHAIDAKWIPPHSLYHGCRRPRSIPQHPPLTFSEKGLVRCWPLLCGPSRSGTGGNPA